MQAKARPFYIDLFDDGIPKGNDLLFRPECADPFDLKLAANAKFQILLAVLFGAEVVVPESWLISSPTFLHIVEEIAACYLSRVPQRVPPKIFRFAFFDADLDNGNAALSYVEAFARRLERGRPIRVLDEAANRGKGLNSSQRQALAKALRDWASSQDPWNMSGTSLTNLLAKQLRHEVKGDMPEGDIVRLTRAYGAVLDYIGKMSGMQLLLPWGSPGEARYRARMKEQVTLVEGSVRTARPEKVEQASALAQFGEFFAEVASKQIPFTDVMGMRQVLRNYDPVSQRTISAFGRYVLNRGYAHGAGARSYLMSFDFYPQQNPSQFDEWLMGQVMASERTAHGAILFPELLDLSGAKSYSLAGTIHWPRAWETLAQVATDPKWLEARTAISRRFYEHTETDLKNHALWEELFDRINGRFHDFSFQVQLSENRVIAVARKATDIGKDMSAPEVAETLFRISEEAAKIVSISFFPLKFLLNMGLSRVSSYRVIRAGRHIDRGIHAAGEFGRGISNIVAR